MPNKKEIHHDLEIQADLTEYQKLRDEIIAHINSSNQWLLVSLGSASVAIPLLFTQIPTLPLSLARIALYALCMIYSVVGMNHVTSIYYINSESNYIYQYLAPRINSRLDLKDNFVFQGETFNRHARRNLFAFLSATIGPIGTSIIILLPALLSLISAEYLPKLLPGTISPQPTSTPIFLTTAMLLFRIMAWLSFITELLSECSQFLYTLTTGFVIQHNSKP